MGATPLITILSLFLFEFPCWAVQHHCKVGDVFYDPPGIKYRISLHSMRCFTMSQVLVSSSWVVSASLVGIGLSQARPIFGISGVLLSENGAKHVVICCSAGGCYRLVHVVNFADFNWWRGCFSWSKTRLDCLEQRRWLFAVGLPVSRQGFDNTVNT